MDENRFYTLLHKKISQNCDQNELLELENLINENEDFAKIYYFFFPKAIINEEIASEEKKDAELSFATLYTKMYINKDVENQEANTNDHYNIINENILSKKKKLVWVSFTSIAAIILMLVGILFLNQVNNAKQTDWKNSNIVTTKKGSKSYLKLPDGTRVWLNTESKLIYPGTYSSTNRQVKLIGEAFFDVVKDPKHPFKITTNDINIKVLGTAFNVKAYPHDTDMETLLIRGKIVVSFNNIHSAEIVLHPGDRLRLFHNDSIRNRVTKATTNDSINKLNNCFTIENIKTSTKEIKDTLWLSNTLVFDSEPLKYIVGKLERWYGVNIYIKDKNLYNTKFTGKFENQSLDFILSTLKETGQINYEMHRDTVTIF